MNDIDTSRDGRFPELGKHLLKTFLQAVIVGVGLEAGRDVYRWLKKQRSERGCEQEQAATEAEPPKENP